jgi:hypothetical protein
MRIMTSIILAGVFLLILGSFFEGTAAPSPSEKVVTGQTNLASQMTPTKSEESGKNDAFSRMKHAFSSFDLVNGLTPQDVEAMNLISHRSMAFSILVGCLWLAFGMKIPV